MQTFLFLLALFLANAFALAVCARMAYGSACGTTISGLRFSFYLIYGGVFSLVAGLIVAGAVALLGATSTVWLVGPIAGVIGGVTPALIHLCARRRF